MIKRVNTVIGQLRGIIRMIENNEDSKKILNQFNTAENALAASKDYLINDVMRKNLAIKLSMALDSCPGNCGQEKIIEKMKNDFPALNEKEILESIKKIEKSLNIMNNS